MTKEDLRRIKDYQSKLAEYREARQRLLDAVTGCTQRLTGMPHGSSGEDKMMRYVAELSELDEKYNDLLISLEREKLRVESAVSSLPAAQERVIRLRYFQGLSWRRVAYKTHYDERQVRRIHAEALNSLSGL